MTMSSKFLDIFNFPMFPWSFSCDVLSERPALLCNRHMPYPTAHLSFHYYATRKARYALAVPLILSL
jgi:hypothetical protein